MRFEDFQRSLEGPAPPAGVPILAAALWWDAKGDWARAHEIAQDVASADGAWIHAYLHRKEGDVGNAGYWYGQAGRPRCRAALELEWEEIVRAVLRE
jgi:hypothetical protein